jgi:cell division protein FtsZ
MDPSLGGKMRVSVVATGIDAVVSAADVPTPRRRMAEPLAPAAVAEPVVEEPAPAPVAQEPVQPSLDVFDSHAAAAEAQAEEHFDATDDLPAPAYQPRPEQTYQPSMHEPEADAYVAPRAPTAGAPSPEAMARLQAAVSRRPEAPAPRQPNMPQPAQNSRSFGAPEQPKQGRFGINSLIGRMTGNGAEEAPLGQQRQAAAAPRVAAQTSRQPQVHQSYDEDQDPNPEQEKIEIPAFLRRQAN